MGIVDRILKHFDAAEFRSDKHAGNYLRAVKTKPRTQRQNESITKFYTPEGYDSITQSMWAGYDPKDKGAKGKVEGPADEINDISAMMEPLPADMLLTWVGDGQQFGLPPERMDEIEEWTGKLVSNKAFSATNLGSPRQTTGPHVTWSILAPRGTDAVVVGDGFTSVILDKDQPLQIMKVEKDGHGGTYIYATAMPRQGSGVAPRSLGAELPESEKSPAIEATPEELAKRGLDADGQPIPKPLPPSGTPAPGEQGLPAHTPAPVAPAGPPGPSPAKAIEESGGEVPLGAGKVVQPGEEIAPREKITPRPSKQVLSPEEARLEQEQKRVAAQQAIVDRQQERVMRAQEQLTKSQLEQIKLNQQLIKQLMDQQPGAGTTPAAAAPTPKKRAVKRAPDSIADMTDVQKKAVVRRDAELSKEPGYPRNDDETRIQSQARQIKQEAEGGAPEAPAPAKKAAKKAAKAAPAKATPAEAPEAPAPAKAAKAAPAKKAAAPEAPEVAVARERLETRAAAKKTAPAEAPAAPDADVERRMIAQSKEREEQRRVDLDTLGGARTSTVAGDEAIAGAKRDLSAGKDRDAVIDRLRVRAKDLRENGLALGDLDDQGDRSETELRDISLSEADELDGVADELAEAGPQKPTPVKSPKKTPTKSLPAAEKAPAPEPAKAAKAAPAPRKAGTAPAFDLDRIAAEQGVPQAEIDKMRELIRIERPPVIIGDEFDDNLHAQLLFGRVPELKKFFEEHRGIYNHLVKEQVNDRKTWVDQYAGATPEMQEKATKAIRRATAPGKPIVVRRSSESSLRDILASGRMKTQHETGTSDGGYVDKALRADFEEMAFGLPKDLPAERRPIYGYVAPRGLDGEHSEGKLDQYGDIRVVLKDSVRPRTTVSAGDSLDRRKELTPMPIDNPDYRAAQPAAAKYNDLGDPQFQQLTYVEAQIHDGVSNDDIEEVLFPREPEPATIAALEKAGIPWRVAPPGGTKKATPAKATPAATEAPAVREPTPETPAKKAAPAKAVASRSTPAERARARRVETKAARLQEGWRKTFEQQWMEERAAGKEGREGPPERLKPTTDKAWIEAHGTDQVDIYNTPYAELPDDWKQENRDAAKVVEDILEKHGGTVDLTDEKTRLEVGEAVHAAWLSRHGEEDWVKGGELDKPFAELSPLEQKKDIDQVYIAMGRRPPAVKKAAPAKAAPVKKISAAAPAAKLLPPLANGTQRKSMTNVEVGDVVRGGSGSDKSKLGIPRKVTKVERDGNRIKITRDDGSWLAGFPNTAVWLGDESAPAAKKAAPAKAAKAAPVKAARAVGQRPSTRNDNKLFEDFPEPAQKLIRARVAEIVAEEPSRTTHAAWRDAMAEFLSPISAGKIAVDTNDPDVKYEIRRRPGQTGFQVVRTDRKSTLSEPVGGAYPTPGAARKAAEAEAKKGFPETPAPKPAAVAKKAAPAVEKAAGTAEGKLTARRLQPGVRVLLEKGADGKWRPTTRKTNVTPFEVVGQGVSSRPRAVALTLRNDDGDQVELHPSASQTFILEPEGGVKVPAKVAKAAAPAKVAKAAKAAAPSTSDRDADLEGKTYAQLLDAAQKEGVQSPRRFNKEALKQQIVTRRSEGSVEAGSPVDVNNRLKALGLPTSRAALKGIASGKIPGESRMTSDQYKAEFLRRMEVGGFERELAEDAPRLRPAKAAAAAPEVTVPQLDREGITRLTPDQLVQAVGDGEVSKSDALQHLRARISRRRKEADYRDLTGQREKDLTPAEAAQRKRMINDVAGMYRAIERVKVSGTVHDRDRAPETSEAPRPQRPIIKRAAAKALKAAPPKKVSQDKLTDDQRDALAPENLRKAADTLGIQIEGKDQDEKLTDLMRYIALHDVDDQAKRAERRQLRTMTREAKGLRKDSEANERFGPGGPDHVDVRQLARDGRINMADLAAYSDVAQARLNTGSSPTQVADMLERFVGDMRTQNTILNGDWGRDGVDLPESYWRGKARTHDREKNRIDQLQKLADKIRARDAGRPAPAKAAPAKATKATKGAKKAAPAKKANLGEALTEAAAPRRTAAEVDDRLKALGLPTDRKELEDSASIKVPGAMGLTDEDYKASLLRRLEARTAAGGEGVEAPRLRAAKAAAPTVAAPSREGRVRDNGKIPNGKLLKGDRVLVAPAEDGRWRPAVRQGGSKPITVDRVEQVGNRLKVVVGHDDDGNEVRVDNANNAVGGIGLPSQQTFIMEREGRTSAKKAAPARAPAAQLNENDTVLNDLSAKKITKAAAVQQLRGLDTPESRQLADELETGPDVVSRRDIRPGDVVMGEDREQHTVGEVVGRTLLDRQGKPIDALGRGDVIRMSKGEGGEEAAPAGPAPRARRVTRPKNPAQIRKDLSAATTPEARQKVLDDLGPMNKTQWRVLAKQLGIVSAGRDDEAGVQAKIVRHFTPKHPDRAVAGHVIPTRARKALLERKTTKERQDYLDSLELSQSEARELARDLGVRGQDRSNVDQIKEKINNGFAPVEEPEVAAPAAARIPRGPIKDPIARAKAWGAEHDYKGRVGGWIFGPGGKDTKYQGWQSLYEGRKAEIDKWERDRLKARDTALLERDEARVAKKTAPAAAKQTPLAELRDRASKAGIAGRSRMTRKDLEEALAKHDRGETEAPTPTKVTRAAAKKAAPAVQSQAKRDFVPSTPGLSMKDEHWLMRNHQENPDGGEVLRDADPIPPQLRKLGLVKTRVRGGKRESILTDDGKAALVRAIPAQKARMDRLHAKQDADRIKNRTEIEAQNRSVAVVVDGIVNPTNLRQALVDAHGPAARQRVLDNVEKQLKQAQTGRAQYRDLPVATWRSLAGRNGLGIKGLAQSDKKAIHAAIIQHFADADAARKADLRAKKVETKDLTEGAGTARSIVDSAIADPHFRRRAGWGSGLTKELETDRGGDLLGEKLAERQGFDALPEVVSRDEFEARRKDMGTILYRGIDTAGRDGGFGEQFKGKPASEVHDEFREGRYHMGNGSFGNGTYMTKNKQHATGYSDLTEGAVARYGLAKDAKIAELPDLIEEHNAYVATLDEDSPEMQLLGNDIGRYAMARGYDAIHVPRGSQCVGCPAEGAKDQYVILNRGKIIAEAPGDKRTVAQARRDIAAAKKADTSTEGQLARVLPQKEVPAKKATPLPAVEAPIRTFDLDEMTDGQKDFTPRDKARLEGYQKQLDEGVSPRDIARDIDQYVNGAASPFYRAMILRQLGEDRDSRLVPQPPEYWAQRDREEAALVAEGSRWAALRDKLKVLRKPSQRISAPPTKATGRAKKAAPAAKEVEWSVEPGEGFIKDITFYRNSDLGYITEFPPDEDNPKHSYKAYKADMGGKASFPTLQQAKDWMEGRDTTTMGEFEPGQRGYEPPPGQSVSELREALDAAIARRGRAFEAEGQAGYDRETPHVNEAGLKLKSAAGLQEKTRKRISEAVPKPRNKADRDADAVAERISRSGQAGTGYRIPGWLDGLTPEQRRRVGSRLGMSNMTAVKDEDLNDTILRTLNFERPKATPAAPERPVKITRAAAKKATAADLQAPETQRARQYLLGNGDGMLEEADVQAEMDRLEAQDAEDLRRLAGRPVDESEKLTRDSVKLTRDSTGDGGIMHGDSPAMKLAQRLAHRGRNGSANKVMDMRADYSGPNSRDPEASQRAVDELRLMRLEEQDPAIRELYDEALSKMDAPERPVPDLPEDTPPLARKLIEDLNRIPLARRPESVNDGDERKSAVEQLAEAFREISDGEPRASDKIRKILRRYHESRDGAYSMWKLDPEAGNNDALSKEIRTWRMDRYRQHQAGEVPAKPEFAGIGRNALPKDGSGSSTPRFEPPATVANPKSNWGKARDNVRFKWSAAHGRPANLDQVDRVYTADSPDDAKQFLDRLSDQKLEDIADAASIPVLSSMDRDTRIDRIIKGIREPEGGAPAAPMKAAAPAAPQAVRAVPAGGPSTDLSREDQARVRRLIRQDPQIYATVQDRHGRVATSGNLGKEDAEWLDDVHKREPAFVEHVAQETQIRRRLDKDAKAAGDTPAAYRAKVAARLKEKFADKPIAVRVRDEDALDDILSNGRFKTQFDRGARRAPGLDSSPERRRLGEHVLGTPVDTAPDKRPVYGYVAVNGVEPALPGGRKISGISQREGQEDSLSPYGRVQVILKPDVRSRTTASVGDSLDELPFVRPSPVDNPSADSLGINKLDAMDSPDWTRSHYVEAQIHGGVTKDDIAEVVFPEQPSPAIAKKLDDAGIPYRVLGRDGETSAPSAAPVKKAAPTKKAAAPKQLTQKEAYSAPPEELAKAADEGRISRRAAAIQIRRRAGAVQTEGYSTDASDVERRRAADLETDRIRALADRVEDGDGPVVVREGTLRPGEPRKGDRELPPRPVEKADVPSESQLTQPSPDATENARKRLQAREAGARRQRAGGTAQLASELEQIIAARRNDRSQAEFRTAVADRLKKTPVGDIDNKSDHNTQGYEDLRKTLKVSDNDTAAKFQARLRKHLESRGITVDGNDGDQVTYDPDKHDLLDGASVQPGELAEIHTPGMYFNDKAPAAPAPRAGVVADPEKWNSGDGVPTSIFLGAESKLGRGVPSNSLAELDRSVRTEDQHHKVPDAYKRTDAALAGAGVGPDERPRKQLREWYESTFKENKDVTPEATESTVVTLQRPVLRSVRGGGDGDLSSRPTPTPDKPFADVETRRSVIGDNYHAGFELLRDFNSSDRAAYLTPRGLDRADTLSRKLRPNELRDVADALHLENTKGDKFDVLRNKVMKDIRRRLGIAEPFGQERREQLESKTMRELLDELPPGMKKPSSITKPQLIDMIVGDGPVGDHHVDLDPEVQALKDAFDAGLTDRSYISTGSMGQVARVEGPDGKKIIRKRMSSDWFMSGEQQADGEQLTSELGRRTGAPQAAVYRPTDRTVFMDEIQGTQAEKHTPEEIDAAVHTPEGRRMAILDAIAGNSDRHNNNWMIVDGRPVGFDNSLAFDDEPKYGPDGEILPDGNHFNDPFRAAYPYRSLETKDTMGVTLITGGQWLDRNEFTTAELTDVRKELEAMKPQFQRLDREAWYDAAHGRLEALIKRASDAPGAPGARAAKKAAPAKATTRAPRVPEGPAVAAARARLEGVDAEKKAKLTKALNRDQKAELRTLTPGQRNEYWRERLGRREVDHDTAVDRATPSDGVSAPTPAAKKAAPAKKPNVRTKAGQRQVIESAIDEALRVGDGLDGPAAAMYVDRMGGRGSPKDVLEGIRDRIRAGEATTDFDSVEYTMNRMTDAWKNNGVIDPATGRYKSPFSDDQSDEYQEFVEAKTRIRKLFTDVLDSIRASKPDGRSTESPRLREPEGPQVKLTDKATVRELAANGFDDDGQKYLSDMPEAQRQAITSAFDVDDDGKSFRVDPERSFVYKDIDGNPVIRVEGDVKDGDGGIVGGFRRVLYPATGTVHNDMFALEKAQQQQGLSTRFNDQQDRRLADLGFTRATISPAFNGGLASARRDFRWQTDRRGAAGDVPSRIGQAFSRATPEEREVLSGWLDRFVEQDMKDWPTPKEISDQGELGRSIMNGSSWSGEKQLGTGDRPKIAAPRRPSLLERIARPASSAVPASSSRAITGRLGGDRTVDSILEEDTWPQGTNVRDLTLSVGYKVGSGTAWRRNGVVYVVEHGDTPEERQRAAVGVNRLIAHANNLPPGASRYQRSYVMVQGGHPREGQWQEKWGLLGPDQEPLRTAASASFGNTIVWHDGEGSGDHLDGDLNHEFGHNVDTTSPVYGSQSAAWVKAATKSPNPNERITDFKPTKASEFESTFPRGNFTYGVTPYATSDPQEDYAESIRLYMLGVVGTGTLTNGSGWSGDVYFRDLFPERAAVLDKLFPELAEQQRADIARARG
jgi:hypothetical protein